MGRNTPAGVGGREDEATDEALGAVATVTPFLASLIFGGGWESGVGARGRVAAPRRAFRAAVVVLVLLCRAVEVWLLESFAHDADRGKRARRCK